jgi:predicted DNA-binding mobile mystery protein A
LLVAEPLLENNQTVALPLNFRVALKTNLNLARLADLDRQFSKLAVLRSHVTPLCGWVKTVRLALGMSSKVLGDRLGMSAQGVRKLEQAEADGSISLKTLSRLADGMDCDVHCVLVPRTSLLNQVLTRAQEAAGCTSSKSAQASEMGNEPETLENLVVLLEQFNKRGFWSPRRTP